MSTTTEVSERTKLRVLMSWITDAPAELELTPANFATVASHVLGRDIQPEDLTGLADALKARDSYEPVAVAYPSSGSADDVDYAITRYLDKRAEIATDVVLDYRECAACHAVIPPDTSFDECPSVAGPMCDWHCHTAIHFGARCPELS